MPQYFGFQLALELSNLIPKEPIAAAASKLMSFARDLRLSGSDIVVEEDLAEIFGRGRMSVDLEKRFKEQVPIQRFTPLSHASEIELAEGSGPTMLRAFRESNVKITVNQLPDVKVVFGTAKEIQLYISWAHEDTSVEYDLTWPYKSEDQGPSIRLHEKDMSVILECKPQEEENFIIHAEARHPIKGYGLTYLSRILNTDAITPENDPAYGEFVKLSSGLAVHASKRFDRNTNLISPHAVAVPGPPMQMEVWRVIDSARLIFDGIVVEKEELRSYARFLADVKLEESSLPSAFTPFLKKGKRDESTAFVQLLSHVQHLAKIIWIFAHVIELENCSEFPLIMDPE
ncbi:MAG: hypothetical protein Q9160_006379 [Pyrenula sp. 1 TL-2023]